MTLRPCDPPQAQCRIYHPPAPAMPDIRVLLVHTCGENGFHPTFELTSARDVPAGHFQRCAATLWAAASDA